MAVFAARLLWLLRDPGPAAADPERVETGFLCVENDDQTDERVCALLKRGRIPVEATLPGTPTPSTSTGCRWRQSYERVSSPCGD